MFEDFMRMQPRIASLLETEFAQGTIPQAVLFSGPEFSGRMSIALQLARAFSCTEKESESSEKQQRKTIIPENNVIVVSPRDHKPRILAAIDSTLRYKDEGPKRQIIESISLLLAQFHGALADAATPTMKKLFEEAGNLRDQLDDFTRIDVRDTSYEASCKVLISSLAPFFVSSPASRILTIAQCREIQGWCRLTALDKLPRIVIIEGVDQATEGARNSLLKLLEDPPENSWFFLITAHPERILATILSRVRHYRFSPLSSSVTQEIISSRYAAEMHKDMSLKDFILTAGQDEEAQKVRQLQEAASAMVKLMLGTDVMRTTEKLSEIIAIVEDSGLVTYFFEQMTRELRNYRPSVSASYLHSCLETISKGSLQYSVYNLSIKSILESIVFGGRAAHE